MSSSVFDITSCFADGLPDPAPRFGGFPKYNFIGGHNDPVQIPIGVPQDHRLAGALRGEQRVNLVAGAGKADDSELHAEPSPSADRVSTIS